MSTISPSLGKALSEKLKAVSSPHFKLPFKDENNYFGHSEQEAAQVL